MKPENRKRVRATVGSFGYPDKGEDGLEALKFKDRDGDDCTLCASDVSVYEKPGTTAVLLGTSFADRSPMHLDRSQVRALVNHLTAWLETGTFRV